jgi:transcriptional regulator with PAS, ATPase and Fis domain
VGETHARPIDVRYVCATNKDIEKEISGGRFREDLYYRLNIVSIVIPPLRERRDDILPLVRLFLHRYGRQLRRPAELSPEALERLLAYSWPGNVRELQNEIQKCLILSEGRGGIRPEDLSPKIAPRSAFSPPPIETEPLRFQQARAEFEKRFLHQALARCRYNRSRTAETIGISRQGLFKLIKKHGIVLPARPVSDSDD